MLFDMSILVPRDLCCAQGIEYGCDHRPVLNGTGVMNASAVSVRSAVPGEASELARLHSRVVGIAYASIFPPGSKKPTPESLEAGWSELIDDAAVKVLVAQEGGDLVGSVVLAPDEAAPSGLLVKRLHVDPARWGLGIGSSLHDQVLDRARAFGAGEVNLWVLEHNVPARAMYERRGWRLVPGRTLANSVASIVDVLYEVDLGWSPA